MEGLNINPLIPMGWFVEVDEPLSREKALGRESYLKSRFYNEIIAPSGYYDAALTVLAKSVNRFGSLSVPSENPVDDGMLQRLRDITPHVRRAVSIADLLDVRSLQSDMLSAAFDLLTVGIVLTDAKARIVHANNLALRYLDQRSAIRRDGDSCPAAIRAPRWNCRRRSSMRPTARPPSSALRHRAADHDHRRHRSRRLGAAADGGLRNQLATSFAASAAVFSCASSATSRRFRATVRQALRHLAPSAALLMMLTQGMTVRKPPPRSGSRVHRQDASAKAVSAHRHRAPGRPDAACHERAGAGVG